MIVALELNVPHTISMGKCDSFATCTLIDANHCPGAVMLHARFAFHASTSQLHRALKACVIVNIARNHM